MLALPSQLDYNFRKSRCLLQGSGALDLMLTFFETWSKLPQSYIKSLYNFMQLYKKLFFYYLNSSLSTFTKIMLKWMDLFSFTVHIFYFDSVYHISNRSLYNAGCIVIPP